MTASPADTAEHLLADVPVPLGGVLPPVGEDAEVAVVARSGFTVAPSVVVDPPVELVTQVPEPPADPPVEPVTGRAERLAVRRRAARERRMMAALGLSLLAAAFGGVVALLDLVH